MNVLVINCGSSSLKFQLINAESEVVLAKGICERIGIDGRLTYQPEGGEKEVSEKAMPTHTEAIQFVIEALTNPETGVVTIKEKTYNFDGKPYDGEHLFLKLPKTEAKLQAFVEKDGKIKDGSVELFDQKGHQLVGDSYMNHGGSVAEARAAIEKAGLPFRI